MLFNSFFDFYSFGRPIGLYEFFFFSFLGCVCSFVLKKIKPTKARYSFSLLCGLFFIITNYGFESINLFVSSIIIYLILRANFIPFKRTIVLALSFIHLIVIHYRRLIIKTEEYSIDVSVAYMIIVLKYITLSFNLHDGKCPEKNTRERTKNSCLQKMPNFFEYCTYLFYFGTVISGPVFDFVRFRKFMNRTLFLTSQNKEKNLKLEQKILKSSTKKSIKRFLKSLFFLGLYLVLSNYISYEKLDEPGFMDHNFLCHTLFVYFLGITICCRYCFAFIITESINIMSGFAYGGMDEVGDFNWNFLNGVDLKSVFLPIHTDKYLNNWHLQTSSWFKEYVYFRIAHPDSPFQNFFAQLVTLLIISFWNGLRRCYYTLYLFWPFWFFADKLLTKSIKPFLNDSSGMTLKKRVWFFKIVLGVLTNLYWSVTLTVFFVCLKWRHTLILLRLTRYPTFIVPIFIIIICSLFLKLTEGIRKGKTTNINRKKVK